MGNSCHSVRLPRHRGGELFGSHQPLIATCVSFAVCLLYPLILPFHPAGLAVLIGVGTLIMMCLGRHEDIVLTASITTVVMVVAAINPQNAWHQPLLRFGDTAAGVAVGVICKWIGSFFYCWREVR